MAKNNTHKKQHFVPKCYLKAWIDPTSQLQKKLEPYVWIFDSDGSNPKRKSVENIFHETDIYTIVREGGKRDLYLEHGFHGVEDKFSRIRNNFLDKRQLPDAERKAWILVFVATLKIRTAAFRDHHKTQWLKILEMMEDLERQHASGKDIPPSSIQSKTSGHFSLEDRKSLSIGDVRRIVDQPINSFAAPFLSSQLKIISQMNLVILCTDSESGFITTDNPCTWFAPNQHKMPPIYRGVGLVNKNIEITLPISPKQCLLLSHRSDLSGFIDIEQNIVDQLNHRHIWHCDRHFISCRNSTNPFWFHKFPLPDDAWENQVKK
jgi:hypothetical protein